MVNLTTIERPHSRGPCTNRLQGGVYAERHFIDRRAPDQLRLDLHDRLGPGLVYLEMRLAYLQDSVGDAGLPPAEVASLRLEVAKLIEELRRIVHSEQPERLERDGLIAAIRRVVSLAARPGLQVSFSSSGTQLQPDAPVAAVIYRAALEGTANVLRHSQASHCHVLIRLADEAVTLKVRDDGVGPGPRNYAANRQQSGLGLASLRNAARLLGGTAQLLKRREGGTSLVVTLPLQAPTRLRRPGASNSRAIGR